MWKPRTVNAVLRACPDSPKWVRSELTDGASTSSNPDISVKI